MVKITYKDAKTGKPLPKVTVENYKPIKKFTKPEVVKVGKVYKTNKRKYPNNTYVEGE